MKKLIDIRTGQAMFFSARTVKAGKLPKYLVDPSKVYAKKEPEAKPHVEQLEEVEKEPTRAEMIDFLRSQGQKVSPNIGNEKLQERYEDTKQAN